MKRINILSYKYHNHIRPGWRGNPMQLFYMPDSVSPNYYLVVFSCSDTIVPVI